MHESIKKDERDEWDAMGWGCFKARSLITSDYGGFLLMHKLD